MNRRPWRDVATAEERGAIRKMAWWNVAIYGSAALIAVAAAGLTRQRDQTATAASHATVATTVKADAPER